MGRKEFAGESVDYYIGFMIGLLSSMSIPIFHLIFRGPFCVIKRAFDAIEILSLGLKFGR